MWQKIGVPEQNGLRSNRSWLNVDTGREGVKDWLRLRNRGKVFTGRLRTAWIDDVRRWTEGGLPAARWIAIDRLWQMKTEKKNIVVRWLLPYKGYLWLTDREKLLLSKIPRWDLYQGSDLQSQQVVYCSGKVVTFQESLLLVNASFRRRHVSFVWLLLDTSPIVWAGWPLVWRLRSRVTLTGRISL